MKNIKNEITLKENYGTHDNSNQKELTKSRRLRKGL